MAEGMVSTMAKRIPTGAQLLTLPIDDCKLNAGYKAPKYRQTYNINHYGWDLGSVSGSRPLRGMGKGVVIAAGADGANTKDRLGNCLVIVYPDVLCRDGTVRALACRMFHLENIAVRAGQEITSETILGRYGATGNPAYCSGPHLHIELDTDTQYPAYAYGVAGGQVIKRGTVDSSLSPSQVFCLGAGQTLVLNQSWVSQGWMTAAEAELPRIGDFSAQGEGISLAEYQAAVARAEAAEAKNAALEEKIRAARAALG